DLAYAPVRIGQANPHAGVVGPLLEEVLVEAQGGQEQLSPQLLHAGYLLEAALAHAGEVFVHRRPRLGEVGLRLGLRRLRLGPELRLALFALFRLALRLLRFLTGLSFVVGRLGLAPGQLVEVGRGADRDDRHAHQQQHQGRRQTGDAWVVPAPAPAAFAE